MHSPCYNRPQADNTLGKKDAISMGKTRVTVTLDDNIETWIQAGAKSINKSWSEIIRICLREFHNEYPNRFTRTDKTRSMSEDAWKK
jgi:hypothetical protein